MSFTPNYRNRHDLQGHADVTFARCFIPEYLQNVSRAVYLDTDTLFMGDIAPLFEMQLQTPLAAVPEQTSFKQLYGKWLSNLAEDVPPTDQSIFNDGVMVLDLDKWRADNITSDLQDLAQSEEPVDEQLLLNLEFQVRKTFDPLPAEWNIFRVRSVGWPDLGWSDDLPPDSEILQARILHWTGAKPWNMNHKQQWIEQYQHLWEAPGADSGATCEATKTLS